MSKISDIIKEYTQNEPVSRVIEQSIKAEIMGLDRYDLCLEREPYASHDHASLEKCKHGDIMLISDLENLFKESE